MKSRRLDRIFFLSAITLFLSTSISLSQSWNALGSGITGKVNASIVFSGQLVVGGEFTSPAGNVAVWNGISWQTLGTGLNGVVYGFTIFNSQLIAVGAFTNGGNNVSRWSGSSWSGLGLGTNDTVYAATVYQSLLRIGGKFTTAGGINCSRVAGWNGTQWTAMGTVNSTDNTVYTLTTFNSELIIGGEFTSIGNLPNANRIARYNASGTYTALGTGIDNNRVLALTTYQNQLYAGGTFTTIGGVPVNNLARWTGSNWNSVISGTNGAVRCFGLQGSNLIIGGSFTGIGNSIASWNGTTFSALGNGLTGGTPSVNSVNVWSNALVASGSFTTAGMTDVPANNVAAYGSVPAAPTLVSPIDGATGVILSPTLDWSDVSLSSSYGVQVSTNPNFNTFILNTSGLSTSSYTFPPQSPLTNNTTYFWRANSSNGLGTSAFSLVRFFTTGPVGILNTQEIPAVFKLHQNFPNPFNPVTKIRFDLPANSAIGSTLELIIYDVNGKEVKRLLNTDYAAGIWEIDFDASDLSSGIYFYRLNAGFYSAINKMILIK
ncbi:MAG: T9SS type A sorting domain-containing protein [Ignavibacteria bacterium]|nr:T9SS type A sorting domain-containing protein [Ignavibacteria bacterium]